MTAQMKARTGLFSTIRLFLIVAIIFLVSLLFTNIIGAPVIAILAYFVLQYRRRIKDLERRMGSPTLMSPGETQGSVPPPPEAPPAPMSTDA